MDGARFLRASGWPVNITGLVAHHTCAVVEADARGLGEALRVEFVRRDDLVQDALWRADATTGPGGERLTLEERVAEVVTRYGRGSCVATSMLKVQPFLAQAIERTEFARDERLTATPSMPGRRALPNSSDRRLGLLEEGVIQA